MNAILDFLLTAIQALPLFVIGFIIFSAAYVCFFYPAMRAKRLQMGASFVVGILAFAVAVVINAQSTVIAWEFSETLPPYSYPGYLVYGIIGIFLGYGIITFVRLAFKSNFPQFLVAILVGISAFALFYYLFANEITTRTISILSLGMLIGVLIHLMLLRVPLRDVVRNVYR